MRTDSVISEFKLGDISQMHLTKLGRSFKFVKNMMGLIISMWVREDLSSVKLIMSSSLLTILERQFNKKSMKE